MAEDKERIDQLLVKRGFFDSREKAQKNIMAGLVFVNNKRIDKPGEKVPIQSNIEVKGEAIPYVSRGGLKLEKAINEFSIDLKDKTAMDVGASTGGFTDCMLKNGAKLVYAVDVGYGQLAWELRTNPKVVCMERTNIRYVKPENIDTKIDFASIDVSFISLKLVLPVVKQLLNPLGEIVCLIKPQFEAGREKVGKKGVVRDAAVHKEVISKILDFAMDIGFKIKGLTFSPIKGPEGNIEYLAYLINDDDAEGNIEGLIEDIVEKSHKLLEK
ncbi:23S rRNA (cytidine1920-2'-O)/16S rRNA (cytidine1409-2'-O)-methyltransferase [Caloramator quimbayensis]|uniref:23S rRNA (Cytidine1920-2'-O)/16S rRNA (Cytidine1409-2'-O)-methyltransferase n=1 Tax=Caloramator quimbayensis TaxID=1147123 RepID=A0A1T4WXF2_9CLOT|nr:TlyA family RNA methyltransferase [Caloramator quimbayensis]SKA82042.1 23S rRNA (cytidine1920-2'-O)/16S rRNA (cytidine1409-2'-O)-methyltransferase [Caloramator quimbayensis]